MGFGAHAFPGVGGEAIGVVPHRCPLRGLDERRVLRFSGALLVAVLQHAGLLLWLAGLGDLEMSPAPPLVVSLDAVGVGTPGAGPGGPSGETGGPAAVTVVEAPLPAAPPAAQPSTTIEVPPPPPPEVVERARPDPPVVQAKTPKPKPVAPKARTAATAAAAEQMGESRGPGTAAGEGEWTGAGTGRGSGAGTGTGGGGTAGAEGGYRAQLVAWLARHKRYPARARAMGLEGQVVVRVTLSRDGRVQSHEIEEDSTYSVLLHEVEAMVERANPFPAMPATLSGERFELRVPVDFRLREPPSRGGT
jgi:protein TonB